MISKNSPIYITVFLFPVLVATVNHGGSVPYLLLLLFGLFIGWPAWQLLESWEKRVLLGLLMFFILISLSLLNTQDLYNGIKKEGRYVLFPLLIPMYLLFKKAQVETGRVYLIGLLVASVVMFGQALYELSEQDWQRADGAYSALIFGDVSMLIAVLVFCALITVAKDWWQYIMGLLAIGLALFASVMSGSRGAWILLPIISILFLFVKLKSLNSTRLLSIVTVAFLLIWGFFSINTVKIRIDNLVDEYQGNTQFYSVMIRIELWRDSITIWKAHPTIGTGIGDFSSNVTQLMSEGLSSSRVALDHAHNIYFDSLATTGLIGFLGLIVFMQIIPFQMFNSFWKQEKDPWIQFYALAGMATIISFAVFGLTEAWLSRNPFVRTYLMSILVFMSSIAIRKQSVVTKDSLKSSVVSLQ